MEEGSNLRPIPGRHERAQPAGPLETGLPGMVSHYEDADRWLCQYGTYRLGTFSWFFCSCNVLVDLALMAKNLEWGG
jgi:hypothetical protein